jgi:hypothetical protein
MIITAKTFIVENGFFHKATLVTTLLSLVSVVGHRGSVPMQSVPITIKVVNWNPSYSEVYSIKHYVIQFVSDLRQTGSVLRSPKVVIHEIYSTRQ